MADQQQELEALVKGLRKPPEPAAAPPAAPPAPDPRILNRLYQEGLRKKMEERQKAYEELQKELGKKTSSAPDIEGFGFFDAQGNPIVRKKSWWV